MRTSEYYKRMVPKGIRANLDYRRWLVELCINDSGLSHEVWMMCRRDLLFWINTFCWTYDPRKIPSVVPMVTWEFQDRMLKKIEQCIGVSDLVVEKSRDMGVSWAVIYAILHRVLYYENQSFLIVSRKEDLVDKPDDPDSLFWKLDFAIKYMPEFLLPNRIRTRLHFHNQDMGGTIDGTSTSDPGRGGRRTAILLDEFAAMEKTRAVLSATGDATRSRIMVSTPMGSGNAFYDKAHDGKTPKITAHWSQHPEKARGLYFVGVKPRSPWYDEECNRRSPYEVAQELDINYLGSNYPFFEEEICDRSEREDVREPDLVGNLDYDLISLEPRGFLTIPAPEGKMLLWCDIIDGRPDPNHQYVIGADISAGTGATPSCLAVIDCMTREKVGEYANAHIDPFDFGRLAVAMCRWFASLPRTGPRDEVAGLEPASLIWEHNGPGRHFAKGVIDSGFRNFYYKEREDQLSAKPTDNPGWYSTKPAKLSLLSDFRYAMKQRTYVERSRHCVAECRHYVYLSQNNSVEHDQAAYNEDPTAARDNHGDRVIASALALRQVGNRDRAAPKLPEPEVASFYRRRQAHEARKAQPDWW